MLAAPQPQKHSLHLIPDQNPTNNHIPAPVVVPITPNLKTHAPHKRLAQNQKDPAAEDQKVQPSIQEKGVRCHFTRHVAEIFWAWMVMLVGTNVAGKGVPLWLVMF